MQRAVEEVAGIYRSADSLAKAADMLRELQERYAVAGIEDHSRTLNTELTAAGLGVSFNAKPAGAHCG